jgi:hypothetical protein
VLGIDDRGRLYYEGEIMAGFGIWPAPIVTIAEARMMGAGNMHPTQELTISVAPVVFREDAFDPVTRIRRGRFYKKTPEGRNDWRVQPHPAFREEIGSHHEDHRWLSKSLFSFNPLLFNNFIAGPITQSQVVLGSGSATTLWAVVGFERITTGEDLVMLKARSRLGLLPDLDRCALPRDGSTRMEEAYERVVDTAYRLGPESVIDRCRDSAQTMLGFWLASNRDEPAKAQLDLAAVSKQVADGGNGMRLAGLGGSMLAALHARTKPNEQVKHLSRSVDEGDAETALGLLGLIAKELGYVLQ